MLFEKVAQSSRSLLVIAKYFLKILKFKKNAFLQCIQYILKNAKDYTSQTVFMKRLYSSLCLHPHTHTLLKNRKIIAKEKITLLKSEVGIYECQLESQKCNHRCVLPEEDSIDICK